MSTNDAGLLDDYVSTFTTEAGRRVLEHLEREHYVGRTILSRPSLGAPIDPLLTASCEGQRVVVLGIKANVAKGLRGRPEPQTQATPSVGKE